MTPIARTAIPLLSLFISGACVAHGVAQTKPQTGSIKFNVMNALIAPDEPATLELQGVR